MTGVLLGVDLGTSAVKALLMRADTSTLTQPIAEETVGYPLQTPYPGWSEQNPEDWWRGTGTAIRGVLARSGIRPDEVKGLALSGQMHGATLLGGHGEVLRPCILWNDQRSGPQCVEITNKVGLETLVQWVGNRALAGFTAPKLLWVREHEPDVFAKLATVLLPKDYMNFRLTGRMVTEVSDASGTLMFNVAERRWSSEMMHALDLSPTILPEVLESTGVVGELTPGAAEHTGLLAGTPVVAGGADNACAAVGVGVVAAGEVMTSLGTSGTVLAPSTAPRLDPDARLHTFCHAVPGMWYSMGVVLSAGGSLRWFRDALAQSEIERAEVEGRDPYNLLMAEAATVLPGSEGLIFLPYLTGERTPYGDPDARGVFFGLSVRHRKEHMVRALLEGVTYALADSTDIMRDLGLELETVRATGGGSRSGLWRQMQADVLRTRVATTRSTAGPAVGAGILAGVGIGLLDSVQSAAHALATDEETAPDDAAAAVYERYRAVYRQLYPALVDQFHELATIVSQD